MKFNKCKKKSFNISLVLILIGFFVVCNLSIISLLDSTPKDDLISYENGDVYKKPSIVYDGDTPIELREEEPIPEDNGYVLDIHFTSTYTSTWSITWTARYSSDFGATYQAVTNGTVPMSASLPMFNNFNMFFAQFVTPADYKTKFVSGQYPKIKKSGIPTFVANYDPVANASNYDSFTDSSSSNKKFYTTDGKVPKIIIRGSIYSGSGSSFSLGYSNTSRLNLGLLPGQKYKIGGILSYVATANADQAAQQPIMFFNIGASLYADMKANTGLEPTVTNIRNFYDIPNYVIYSEWEVGFGSEFCPPGEEVGALAISVKRQGSVLIVFGPGTLIVYKGRIGTGDAYAGESAYTVKMTSLNNGKSSIDPNNNRNLLVVQGTGKILSSGTSGAVTSQDFPCDVYVFQGGEISRTTVGITVIRETDDNPLFNSSLIIDGGTVSNTGGVAIDWSGYGNVILKNGVIQNGISGAPGQTASSTISLKNSTKFLVLGGYVYNFTGGNVISLSGSASLEISGTSVVSNDSDIISTIINTGSGKVTIKDNASVVNTGGGKAVSNTGAGSLEVDSGVAIGGGVEKGSSTPSQIVNVKIPQGTTNNTEIINSLLIYGDNATFILSDHYADDNYRNNSYHIKQLGNSVVAFIRVGFYDIDTKAYVYRDIDESTNKYPAVLPSFVGFTGDWKYSETSVAPSSTLQVNTPHNLIQSTVLSPLTITKKVNSVNQDGVSAVFSQDLTYTLDPSITHSLEVNKTYQWAKSTDGNTFTNISLQTGQSISSIKNVNQSGYYKLVINYSITYNGVYYSSSNEVLYQISITPKDLTSSNFSTIATQYYSGSAISPSITITDGAHTLGSGEFGTTYSNNINPSASALMTITLNETGNYTYNSTYTRNINYTISSIQISNVVVNNTLLNKTFYAFETISEADLESYLSINLNDPSRQGLKLSDLGLTATVSYPTVSTYFTGGDTTFELIIYKVQTGYLINHSSLQTLGTAVAKLSASQASFTVPNRQSATKGFFVSNYVVNPNGILGNWTSNLTIELGTLSYAWSFTPADTTNYLTFTGTFVIQEVLETYTLSLRYEWVTDPVVNYTAKQTFNLDNIIIYSDEALANNPGIQFVSIDITSYVKLEYQSNPLNYFVAGNTYISFIYYGLESDGSNGTKAKAYSLQLNGLTVDKIQVSINPNQHSNIIYESQLDFNAALLSPAELSLISSINATVSWKQTNFTAGSMRYDYKIEFGDAVNYEWYHTNELEDGYLPTEYVVVVTEVVVSYLQVTTNPTKVSYIAREEFSGIGLLINAVHNDGSILVLSTDDFDDNNDFTIAYQTVSPYFKTTDSYVIVSFGGQDVQITVTVAPITTPTYSLSNSTLTYDGSYHLIDVVGSLIDGITKVAYIKVSSGTPGAVYLDSDYYIVANVNGYINAGTYEYLYKFEYENKVYDESKLNNLKATLQINKKTLDFSTYAPYIDTKTYYVGDNLPTLLVSNSALTTEVNNNGGFTWDNEKLLQFGSAGHEVPHSYTFRFIPNSSNYVEYVGSISITALSVTLNSISLGTSPTLSTYYSFQTVNTAGMKIIGNFNNGSRELKSNEYIIQYKGTNATFVGDDSYFYVTATELIDRSDLRLQVPVTINKLSYESVTFQNSTFDYVPGYSYSIAVSGLLADTKLKVNYFKFVGSSLPEGTENIDWINTTEGFYAKFTNVSDFGRFEILARFSGDSVNYIIPSDLKAVLLIQKILELAPTLTAEKSLYYNFETMPSLIHNARDTDLLNNVTGSIEWNDGSDALTFGQSRYYYTFTPSGSYNGIYKIVQGYRDLNVEKIVSATYTTTNDSKSEYIDGQLFDTTGIQVELTFSSAATPKMYRSDFTYSTNAIEMGTTKMVLSYAYVTVNYPITVIAKKITGIEVTLSDDDYSSFDVVDLTDIQIVATWNFYSQSSNTTNLTVTDVDYEYQSDQDKFQGFWGTDTYITFILKSDHSITDQVELTVRKLSPAYETPTVPSYVYGEILSSKNLTTTSNIEYDAGIWEWLIPSDSVGEPGVNSHYAQFTPVDQVNFKILQYIPFDVTVSRATPSYTKPTDLTVEYGKYQSQISLDSWTGWSFVSSTYPSSTLVGEIGRRDIYLNYTPADTVHYLELTNIANSYTVIKAVGTSDPLYAVPSELTVTYGKMLSAINLPTYWSWEGSPLSTSVGNAGTNYFNAKYSPKENNHYNTVTNVSLQVIVTKANPDYGVFPSGLSIEYSGDPKTLVEISLPTGWSWMNEETPVGTAGNNKHYLRFTPEDTDNYNILIDLPVYVNVGYEATDWLIDFNAGDLPTNLTLPYGTALNANMFTGLLFWKWEWKTLSQLGDARPEPYQVEAYYLTKDQNYPNNFPESIIDGVAKILRVLSVTVVKADPTYTIPTSIEGVYGDILSSVGLPKNSNGETAGIWQWTTPDITFGEPGTNSHNIYFSPTQSNNYNTVEKVIEVVVNKATPIYTIPVGIEVPWNTVLHSIPLVVEDGSTPGRWDWSSADGNLTVIGEQSLYITYTPTDGAHYNSIIDAVVSVNVVKAIPNDIVIPTNFEGYYSNSINSLAFTRQWEGTQGLLSWDDNSIVFDALDNVTYYATYTPYDVYAYEVVRGIPVVVHVNRINPPQLKITNLVGYYNTPVGSISLSEYPGLSWLRPDDLVGFVGTTRHQVVYDKGPFYNITWPYVDVTVLKATPSFTLPSDVTVEFTKILRDITLPSSFRFASPDDSVGFVGVRQFDAYYTPDDTVNYAVTLCSITVTVLPTLPSFTVPTDLVATYGDKLSAVKLPSGRFKWNNPDESVGNAGVRSFYATYTPDDFTNYLVVNDVLIELTINKAIPKDFPQPVIKEIIYLKDQQTYGEIKLPVEYPNQYSWALPGEIITGKGLNFTDVIYTPMDTENFERVSFEYGVSVREYTYISFVTTSPDPDNPHTMPNIILIDDSGSLVELREKYDPEVTIFYIVLNGRSQLISELMETLNNDTENLKFVDTDKITTITPTLYPTTYLKTGMEIHLIYQGKIVDSFQIIVTGDVNSDGLVDEDDIYHFQNYYSGFLNPSKNQLLAMDLNYDGLVNNFDVVLLNRAIFKLDLVPAVPVDEPVAESLIMDDVVVYLSVVNEEIPSSSLNYSAPKLSSILVEQIQTLKSITWIPRNKEV